MASVYDQGLSWFEVEEFLMSLFREETELYRIACRKAIGVVTTGSMLARSLEMDRIRNELMTESQRRRLATHGLTYPPRVEIIEKLVPHTRGKGVARYE